MSFFNDACGAADAEKPSNFRCDLRRSTVLVLTAVAGGLVWNFVRNPPLPWSYRTKAERLGEETRGLAGAAVEETGGRGKGTVGAFPRISLTELRTALADGKTVLIDARPLLFFRNGHLPGARNLPRDGFQAVYNQHRGILEGEREGNVVVYCQGGSCEDSDLIAEALRSLGFARLTVFAGGWKEWKAAGLPVETGL